VQKNKKYRFMSMMAAHKSELIGFSGTGRRDFRTIDEHVADSADRICNASIQADNRCPGAWQDDAASKLAASYKDNSTSIASKPEAAAGVWRY